MIFDHDHDRKQQIFTIEKIQKHKKLHFLDEKYERMTVPIFFHGCEWSIEFFIDRIYDNLKLTKQALGVA